MDKESFLSEIEIDTDIIDPSGLLDFSKESEANFASKPNTSKSTYPSLCQSFLRLKEEILSRADRSIVGCVDEAIAQFVSAINSEAAYCTTSSCSGRVVIVQVNIDVLFYF